MLSPVSTNCWVTWEPVPYVAAITFGVLDVWTCFFQGEAGDLVLLLDELWGDGRGHAHQLLQAPERIPVCSLMQSNWKPEPQTAVRKVHSQVPSREKLGDECSCLLLLF